MLARSWALETQSTALRVNCADPGGTRTAMRAQAFPGENPDTLRTPAEVARTLLPLIGPDTTFTGRLYQAKHDRWMDYALPGASA